MRVKGKSRNTRKAGKSRKVARKNRMRKSIKLYGGAARYGFGGKIQEAAAELATRASPEQLKKVHGLIYNNQLSADAIFNEVFPLSDSDEDPDNRQALRRIIRTLKGN